MPGHTVVGPSALTVTTGAVPGAAIPDPAALIHPFTVVVTV